jgi:dTDP-4-dehydrorhamnose reductase
VIRVLVTGSRGQVGSEVVRALAGRAEVFAHDRATLDLAKAGDIAARVREARPDVIVNAAAYTAVDRAESDEAAARAVNAVAAGALAEEARRAGALLVHYSTDYVFDGAKQGAYVESDAPQPLNAYGRTKLEGERLIVASAAAHLILRTSWVYGPQGGNFVRTMLRLAETREELRIVDDQRGAPTSSVQLAQATVEMLGGVSTGAIAMDAVAKAKSRSGLYHATAAGETTWFDFARAIFAEWSQRAGAGFRAPRLVPIASRDYPTPARRPANSVLDSSHLADTFGVRLGPWREALAQTLSALR